MEREALERRWFELTREIMPSLAVQRGWPIYLDHCFQRILLDHAAGGPWRDYIPAPAYRGASDEQLRAAIALGEGAMAGKENLAALNRQSLIWRGKV